MYATHQAKGDILMWCNNSYNITRRISGNLSDPFSVFVTHKGDIYANDAKEGSKGQVNRWTMNTKSWMAIMPIDAPCYSLFVDVNDTLYCSLRDRDKVVKKWLNDNATTWKTAAGNGTKGTTPNMLHFPLGIFVDVTLDLYVADCHNNRIQHFQSGWWNGTTVAGNSSLAPTITLDCPAGIALDGEKYLFIMDQVNHRIVASGPNGFRCLVGCNGGGPTSNQLSYPLTLSFDHTGNMFVTDIGNHRIQNFLKINPCGKYMFTLESFYRVQTEKEGE